jgi:hypothetical protein
LAPLVAEAGHFLGQRKMILSCTTNLVLGDLLTHEEDILVPGHLFVDRSVDRVTHSKSGGMEALRVSGATSALRVVERASMIRN